MQNGILSLFSPPEFTWCRNIFTVTKYDQTSRLVEEKNKWTKDVDFWNSRQWPKSKKINVCYSKSIFFFNQTIWVNLELIYSFMLFINWRLKSPIALVPLHIFSSFSYLMDIIKDVVQLALLIYAVGGVGYLIKDWTSFSSFVSIQRVIKK